MTRDADSAAPSAVSGDAPAIGVRLRDRYQILSEIGRGGFGSVHVALDELTGQRVAVRHLPDGVPGTAVQWCGAITASQSHPDLIRVLDTGVGDDGRFFIVLKLGEGAALSETLSRAAPMALGAAVHIALRLGAAVDALHSVGLVHGALRPRNVRVLADGRVTLMDVEIIALRGPTGDETAPPEYLAPEQLRGETLTEKTDVYALGVLLYEMLCGVPPFRGATREAVAAAQQAGPPRLRWRRGAIPVPIKRAIAKALDKRPQRRPYMSEFMNHLADELLFPVVSPMKRVAVVAGFALAGIIAVVLAWTAVVSVTRPRALPPPRPIVVEPAAQLSEPATTATPTPAEDTSTPAAAVTLTPPAPVTSIQAAMPRRSGGATPSVDSSPSTPARRENPPPAAAASEPAPRRPTAASGEADPGAVIDWLLKRSTSRAD